MGKLLITSEKYNSLKDFFSWLNISSTHYFSNCKVLTYSKYCFSTQNKYDLSKDWIVGVGTFVYKGEKDDKALALIMQNFDPINISLIKQKIYGSYCIAIYVNDIFYIFIDNLGSYSMYYFLDNKDIIITNTWFHIMKIIKEPKINYFEWLEYLNYYSNFGKETPVQSVYRLCGNQVIVYKNFKWEVLNTPIIIDNNRIRDFWNDIKIAYKEITSAIPKQSISYTGGIDSRLNLALIMNSGVRPLLAYGIGNSKITNTKTIDYKIYVETYKKFSLTNMDLNFKEPEEFDFELINKLGEYYLIYNGNSNIFNSYVALGRKVSSVSMGYTGEYIRNNDYDIGSKVINVKEYLVLFFESKILKYASPIYDDLLNRMSEKLTNELILYGINPEKITNDDIGMVNFVAKIRIDSRMSNYCNLLMYSNTLIPNLDIVFSQTKVLASEKSHGKYLIEGINRINKNLLTIPIYSRHTLRKITDKLKVKVRNKVISILKSFFIKFYYFTQYSFLRTIYFILIGDYKGYSELKKEKQLLKSLILKLPFKKIESFFPQPSKLKRIGNIEYIDSLLILLRLTEDLNNE